MFVKDKKRMPHSSMRLVFLSLDLQINHFNREKDMKRNNLYEKENYENSLEDDYWLYNL